MSEYRLHIDIPLGSDLTKAERSAQSLMEWYFKDIDAKEKIKRLVVDGTVSTINYRLGHDEDRQKSNYLDVNENGHASNKKTRITISG
tara:strand:+ start:64 stop:327 length:264 start_codon:yes stop_codon:yes gene_type:complete